METDLINSTELMDVMVLRLLRDVVYYNLLPSHQQASILRHACPYVMMCLTSKETEVRDLFGNFLAATELLQSEVEERLLSV